MTSEFVRSPLVSADISRRSFPAKRGAASSAQSAICVRYSSRFMWPLPTSNISGSFQSVLSKPNQRHAVVTVADVSCSPPQIAGFRSPPPRRLHAPVANAEHNRTPGLRKRIAKFCILHLRIETLRVAPVDLHIIDSPRGIRLGVLDFVIQAARPLFASARACVRVKAQL